MASQRRLQTSRQGACNDGGGGVLPRDALYEILLRVPAWALCRFRAVCQSWRSLLSGPRFIAAHAARHRHRDPLFAVCGRGGGEIKLLDASGRVVKRLGSGPPPSSSSRLRWIHPQHDLVLIHREVAGEDGHYQTLHVLDPATGAVSLLPDKDDDFYSSSGTCAAFGRAVGGEYKVLSLSRARGDAQQLCRVLTVDRRRGGRGGGTWREFRNYNLDL